MADIPMQDWPRSGKLSDVAFQNFAVSDTATNWADKANPNLGFLVKNDTGGALNVASALAIFRSKEQKQGSLRSFSLTKSVPANTTIVYKPDYYMFASVAGITFNIVDGLAGDLQVANVLFPFRALHYGTRFAAPWTFQS